MGWVAGRARLRCCETAATRGGGWFTVAATPAGRRRRFSAAAALPRRRCVALLLAALTIPAAACSSGGGADRITTNARITLNAYTGLVEQHLSSVVTALAAAAATSDAASGQWVRIRPALATTSGRVGTDAAMWYVRPDGSYYTVQHGLANENLSDRPYFPALMSGHDVEGTLVLSKSTGRMSCIVATPVRVGGKVVGGLGASIDMVELSRMVNATMAPPPNMVFYALDQQGRIAFNGNTRYTFGLPSRVGGPALSKAVQQMLGSPAGSISYTFNGVKRVVVFKRSTATGWVFALGEMRP